MNRRLLITSISFAVTFLIFGLVLLSIKETFTFFGLFPLPFFKEVLLCFSAIMFVLFTASLFKQRIMGKFEELHERPPNSKSRRVCWATFLGIFWLAWTIEFLVGYLEAAKKVETVYQSPVRLLGIIWYMLVVLALLIKPVKHFWYEIGSANIIMKTQALIARVKYSLLEMRLHLYDVYSWGARLFSFISCLLFGWLVYSYLLLDQFSISNLKGQDLLAIIGISFGFYAVIQVILRYCSAPTPKIIISSTQPKRLGPREQLDLPPHATDEQTKTVQHANRLRQFAAHHLEVWSVDVPWYFRPLTQKIAIEGCHIRFRYTRIDDYSETLMLKGNWLYGRWNDNPEPITEGGFQLSVAISNRRLAKLFPTEKRGSTDAYPFATAFVMKKQGTDVFYHFNDESYQYNDWCNPDWLFGQGTYRVDVRLTGYGLLRPITRTLKLINKGINIDDLLIEDWK